MANRDSTCHFLSLKNKDCISLTDAILIFTTDVRFSISH